ncbi:DUF2183 domain-containing protein [Microbacterium paludicola]|uniref:DUF2183 domain-containing protein n=1 Tax=Microbacterium paludicola TaxID=300019 RepID=A0A4Y9G091_9MICO|nr:phosphatase domain-containing protein [Microbacterium paludicola]MBF0815004.1 DUF2183 domain-containing protein [Microbacterium paludicola]TFU34724.1 DUF2183 domain-containing protein [Microbacterium paludicola]
MPSTSPRDRIHWIARIERRVHAWRERRARRHGRKPTVLVFPGYGGEGWVRVLGRVLIVPPTKRTKSGELASVRGWRSFLGIPVGYSTVRITIGDETHEVVADRGGVIDARIEAKLEPGWQLVRMAVEDGEPGESLVQIVAPGMRHGVVSDVDDTVMVTALPRPLLAAWNSFVLDEHARQPVPGMAVLLGRLTRQQQGLPMVYLSTGAWNVAPTLTRFLNRHLFPAGSLLLTDWGPTHDRWFRSGSDHKATNLRRLAEEFPDVRWLLIGDDGQHDDAIYTAFASEYPQSVAGVAIRRLSPAEAVLAGGRTAVNDHSGASIPWVTADDGAGLAERLEAVGLLDPES